MNMYLLPEGFEDVVSPRAWALEQMGRAIIDLHRGWGYALVSPPMVEYLESLLAGTGEDVSLNTFRVTDQQSGRMMGIRADMTPQLARIDAQVLQRSSPARLCYLGTVLHARHQFGGASRSPMQLGAELYGHAGVESDIEVLLLLLATLQVAGLPMRDVHIDLGHMGLYRALSRAARFDAEQDAQVFLLLQRKAMAELVAILSAWRLPSGLVHAFCSMMEYYTTAAAMQAARAAVLPVAADAEQCFLDLEQLVCSLAAEEPEVTVHYAFCELRGYRYHTGISFSAYCPGYGDPVALGGRYDGVGKAFGHARPATGFSLDAKTLLQVSPSASWFSSPRLIFAPLADDPALAVAVQHLRRRGEAVVMALPGQQTDAALVMGCTHVLEDRDGFWQAIAIDAA